MWPETAYLASLAFNLLYCENEKSKILSVSFEAKVRQYVWDLLEKTMFYSCEVRLSLWNQQNNYWAPTKGKLRDHLFRACQETQDLAASVSSSLSEKKGHMWVEGEPALPSQRWPGWMKCTGCIIREIVVERADHWRIPGGSCIWAVFGKKKLVGLWWKRKEGHSRKGQQHSYLCWRPNLHRVEGSSSDWQIITSSLGWNTEETIKKSMILMKSK